MSHGDASDTLRHGRYARRQGLHALTGRDREGGFIREATLAEQGVRAWIPVTC